MLLMPYESLPKKFKNKISYNYYLDLKQKENYLIFKRFFDVYLALILLILTSPMYLGIGYLIKKEDGGNVFFAQERVKQYGKKFYIYKFRTMRECDDKVSLTAESDLRITRIGNSLRKYRLDELPQLVNILLGDMSFVGARPEVLRYVKCYTDEMYSTLLLPVGLTSKASIAYKNESKLLDCENRGKKYVEVILPSKMKLNIDYLKKVSFKEDMSILLSTFFDIFINI